MLRKSLLVGAFVVAVAGCSVKEGAPTAGASGGFPEKGFAKVAENARKAESQLDHALLAKANDARSRMRAEEIKYDSLKALSGEDREAMERIALASGFESIEEFDKAFNDLMGVRHAIGRLRSIEGEASGFQVAVAGELIKGYTEADLRYVAGLE